MKPITDHLSRTLETYFCQPLKRTFCDRKYLAWLGSLLVIIFVTVFYRWYQPLTNPALVEFDIFDWARQSREWLMYGHLITPTTLWVFPIWNALVSKFTGVDLFYVYLYSGAILTTFNLLIIYGISSALWKSRFLRLIPLVFYALNTQLLARSVNYLPETMSYTFGLALLYMYIRLIVSRQPWWLIPIAVINYLYFHLHQSGINFIIFTVGVIIVYILFIIRKNWIIKTMWLAIGLAIGSVLIFSNSGIKQQIAYFIKGSDNVDIAFQGTAIPNNQIFTDFPMAFYAMLILGSIAIIWQLFSRRPVKDKISWLIILVIAGFYYSFLYVLPNLKLYSLVPWRFYTWFSLYSIFIVSFGVSSVIQVINQKKYLQILIILFIAISMTHTLLIPDDMYTADATTIRSMGQMKVDDGSTVLTTFANYMQAKYALTGRDIIFNQAGANLYKAGDAKTANSIITGSYGNNPVYILFSFYQFRQHPSQMAFWRNSAIPDSNLETFNNSSYFETVYRDDQVWLVKRLDILITETPLAIKEN